MILRVFSTNLQFDSPPTIRHKKVSVTIVCIPPFLLGFEPPTKFSKTGVLGLDRISMFRDGLLVKKVVIFLRGLQILHEK